MTATRIERTSLGLSLTGVAREGVSPRGLIAWAGGVGVSSVALDVTRAELRPRELDRSARRDLAAALRRAELGLAGLDLLIPPRHFIEPAHVDRACAAVAGACALAGELVGLVDGRARVCVEFPAEIGEATLTALAGAALAAGAVLVDVSWPAVATRWRPGLHAGIDVGAALAASADPAAGVLAASSSLEMIRVADWDGARRAAVGRGGRLDAAALRATLSVLGRDVAVVVDARGIDDAERAVRGAAAAWA